MSTQIPLPPSISPRQMTLLRVVTAMAWSDGHLASEEIDVMLARFSRLFCQDEAQQQKLQQELYAYMTQNIPLEELTPKLQSLEERELVLKLGYEVIQSSSRIPEEPKINLEEAAAYQKLVQLLDLTPAQVQKIEAEVAEEWRSGQNIVDMLTRQIEEFMHS
jgi:hypothetical protein